MENQPHSDAVELEEIKLGVAGGLHWVHWIVLSLSLALTFAAWYFSQSQLEAKNAVKFEREADQVTALILERMGKYEDGLWGGVGLIRASDKVSHTQWLEFANSLRLEERYPGVNGIGVIHNVPRKKVATFLAQQRKERPDFRIHPEHKEVETYPITYIEPVDINKKAVGLDMAHETNRYTAAKKSRDTGTAQITGPITLVQDAGKTPGFLFYAPFYKGGRQKTQEGRRKNFEGLVYAPFVVNKLMEGVLARTHRHVGIKLSDGEDVLYDDHVASQPDYDPNPIFQRTTNVELYGRLWTFDIRSAKSFRAAATNSQPYTILIGGLLIDSLLLALFILLSGSNRRAVEYAERANRDLIQKAEHLKKSNRDLGQLSHLVSHDLKAPLRGIKTMAAFMEEDSKEGLEPECQEHLSKIVGLVGRMERLLSDLLGYSNIVNREIEEPLELIDLESLIDEVCQLNDRDRSAISINHPEIKFAATRFPLRTVLNNLISNSFHHGAGADKTCSIQVACRNIENGMLEFSVRDHGPGILPGQEESIFTIFKRFSTQDERGSGVGLALVKRLVLNAGGKIWLEHPEGGGAKILFTWPFAPVPDENPV